MRSENPDHFLLHYSFAGELCEFILGMFRVWWVMPKTVLLLIQGWRRKPNSFWHRAWDLVHPCLMWTLQRESTQRIFREQQFSTMRIKLTLVSSLFSWLLVDKGWPTGFVDFISSLHFWEIFGFQEEET